MKIEVLRDPNMVAQQAAAFIAAAARNAVVERGQFNMALSGGRTPWQMLRFLVVNNDVPWPQVSGAGRRAGCTRWSSRS